MRKLFCLLLVTPFLLGGTDSEACNRCKSKSRAVSISRSSRRAVVLAVPVSAVQVSSVRSSVQIQRSAPQVLPAPAPQVIPQPPKQVRVPQPPVVIPQPDKIVEVPQPPIVLNSAPAPIVAESQQFLLLQQSQCREGLLHRIFGHRNVSRSRSVSSGSAAASASSGGAASAAAGN